MQPEFITPYLPPEAVAEIRMWTSGGKPAFHRVLEQPRYLLMKNPPPTCKNCAGAGVLYISYCEDKNYKYNPSTREASTFFEGNERWFAGWYKVKSTKFYDCPACGGSGKPSMVQAELSHGQSQS